MTKTNMPTIILRSVCVGIASVLAVAGLSLLAGVATALQEISITAPPGAEVGVDLVTLVRNAPATALLLPLLAFPIGFYFGFRHFSRSLAQKQERQ